MRKRDKNNYYTIEDKTLKTQKTHKTRLKSDKSQTSQGLCFFNNIKHFLMKIFAELAVCGHA